jgi:hypothetical protein
MMGCGRALDDLQHAAFRTARDPAARCAHAPVFVQHGAHLVGGQVDVGAAIVADEEAVSIAVPLNGAFNFVSSCAGGVVYF